MVASLLSNVIQAPVVVGTYEILKNNTDTDGLRSFTDMIPLPYVAGAVSALVLHPLDTVKKVLMLSAYGAKGQQVTVKTYSALRAIIGSQGLSSLYSGFTMTFVRNVVWLSIIYPRQTEAYKKLENL